MMEESINQKILTEQGQEGTKMLEFQKRSQLKRCENSSLNLGCQKTCTIMKVQNDGEIYKSKNIDCIGVGRRQNVRNFKQVY